MTFEDLQDHDIFLPKDEWGSLDLHTSVRVPYLVAAAVVGLLSVILMVAAAGQLLTWIGAILYVLFLGAFTIISNEGINNQNEKIDQMMEQSDRSDNQFEPHPVDTE